MDDNDKDNLKDSSPEELLKKLDDVVRPYREQEEAELKKAEAEKESEGAYQALQSGMHVISGVAVGGLIGYGLDSLFDTKPILLAIMIPLGLVAGFVNMVRSLKD